MVSRHPQRLARSQDIPVNTSTSRHGFHTMMSRIFQKLRKGARRIRRRRNFDADQLNSLMAVKFRRLSLYFRTYCRQNFAQARDLGCNAPYRRRPDIGIPAG
jgi:hypothetical protein